MEKQKSQSPSHIVRRPPGGYPGVTYGDSGEAGLGARTPEGAGVAVPAPTVDAAEVVRTVVRVDGATREAHGNLTLGVEVAGHEGQRLVGHFVEVHTEILTPST